MDMLTAKTAVAVACIIAAAAVRIFAKPDEWGETTGWGWFLLIAVIMVM